MQCLPAELTFNGILCVHGALSVVSCTGVGSRLIFDLKPWCVCGRVGGGVCMCVRVVCVVVCVWCVGVWCLVWVWVCGVCVCVWGGERGVSVCGKEGVWCARFSVPFFLVLASLLGQHTCHMPNLDFRVFRHFWYVH